MLPRGLYELLPYLYLIAGVAGGMLIETSLIMIGSMLLISAGLLTLYMRYQYRSGRLAAAGGDVDERRTGRDRRRRERVKFPLVDSQGNLIIADRRLGDRRGDMQQFA